MLKSEEDEDLFSKGRGVSGGGGLAHNRRKRCLARSCEGREGGLGVKGKKIVRSRRNFLRHRKARQKKKGRRIDD